MHLFVIAQGGNNLEKHEKCCGQKAKSEFPCGYTLGNVTLRGKLFPGKLEDLVESRFPCPGWGTARAGSLKFVKTGMEPVFI